jgi:Na+/proline symporter
MNGMVNVVLYFPRYMMITGITVLALAFCMPQLQAMDKPDFEKLLPIVLTQHVPVGVVGFLLAGLLAAFMSNFAATLNAAPAYIVNDIYKRFLNPGISPRNQVRMGRLSSVGVLIVGILFGLITHRITDVMMWIVGALYGGYVMANVLKWYWWRFNSYGYFWGMISGIVSAMFVPTLATYVLGRDINPLYTFPVIFAVSVLGCVIGTLATKPEADEVLIKFYTTVRPWGFWGPIRDKVLKKDPSFKPNTGFKRDAVNVLVGIVWQLCLTSLPIYLVLQHWYWMSAVATVLAITSLFLKYNWYDRLEERTGIAARSKKKATIVS